MNHPLDFHQLLFCQVNLLQNKCDYPGFFSLGEISAARTIRGILQGWLGDQYTNTIKHFASLSPETGGIFNAIHAIDFVLSAKEIITTGFLVGSLVTNGLKKFPFGISNSDDLLSTSTHLSRKALRHV